MSIMMMNEIDPIGEGERIWEVLVTAPSPLHDFNGHFWIRKDGVNCDNYPWDKSIDDFRRAFGITKKFSKLQYEICSEKTTNLLVRRMIKKKFEASGYPEEYIKQFIGEVWTEPDEFCCLFNSISRQQKIGGRLVFGSVYMRSDDGRKKHYICGVPNARVFNDFKKNYDPMESLLIP